jgi:hypothetical protein
MFELLPIRKLKGGIYIDSQCESVVVLGKGVYISAAAHLNSARNDEFQNDIKAFLKKWFPEFTPDGDPS